MPENPQNPGTPGTTPPPEPNNGQSNVVAPWDGPAVPVIKGWVDVLKIGGAIILFYAAGGAHNVFASAVNFAAFHANGSNLSLPGLTFELFNGAKFSVLDGILKSIQGASIAYLGPYYGPVIQNSVRVVGQFSQAIRAKANPNWRQPDNNNDNVNNPRR